MNKELEGKRVRLIHCGDRYTKLQPGTEGTVLFTDDLGTVHIAWDNGSRLGLCPDGGDRFALLT
jgi:hypothetical protein